ncbi:MAG: hypothetical protein DRP12_02280, partial [Candidatus Aenigmatarchaeota archaeon]
ELHNKTRPLLNKKPTYREVIKNIEQAKKYMPVQVITVITSYNVDHLEEIYESYQQKEIDEVLFSPVCPTSFNQTFIPSPEILYKNMKSLIENIVTRYKKGDFVKPKIRNIKDYLSLFLFPKNTETCIGCSSGISHPLLAIDLDGKVYPCDSFFGEEGMKLGDIENGFEKIIEEGNKIRYNRSIDQIENCNKCNWKRFCGGGCIAESYYLYKDIHHPTIYCEYNKKMFEFFASMLPSFLESGIENFF